MYYSQSLRSSGQMLLVVSSTQFKTRGDLFNQWHPGCVFQLDKGFYGCLILCIYAFFCILMSSIYRIPIYCEALCDFICEKCYTNKHYLLIWSLSSGLWRADQLTQYDYWLKGSSLLIWSNTKKIYSWLTFKNPNCTEFFSPSLTNHICPSIRHWFAIHAN